VKFRKSFSFTPWLSAAKFVQEGKKGPSTSNEVVLLCAQTSSTNGTNGRN